MPTNGGRQRLRINGGLRRDASQPLGKFFKIQRLFTAYS